MFGGTRGFIASIYRQAQDIGRPTCSLAGVSLLFIEVCLDI